MCFTSCGSNGGCWVVLGVLPFFFPEKKKCTRLTPAKKVHATYARIFFLSLVSICELHRKRKCTQVTRKQSMRLMLFSALDLHFLLAHWKGMTNACLYLCLPSRQQPPSNDDYWVQGGLGQACDNFDSTAQRSF